MLYGLPFHFLILLGLSWKTLTASAAWPRPLGSWSEGSPFKPFQLRTCTSPTSCAPSSMLSEVEMTHGKVTGVSTSIRTFHCNYSTFQQKWWPSSLLPAKNFGGNVGTNRGWNTGRKHRKDFSNLFHHDHAPSGPHSEFKCIWGKFPTLWLFLAKFLKS